MKRFHLLASTLLHLTLRAAVLIKLPELFDGPLSSLQHFLLSIYYGNSVLPRSTALNPLGLAFLNALCLSFPSASWSFTGLRDKEGRCKNDRRH